MRITIIGAGRVGSALAAGWRAAGHTIAMGVRDPRAHGGEGEYLAVAEALAHPGDVVVLALPFAAATELASEHAQDLAGRVVVDATNDVEFDDGPRLASARTAAARLAAAIPEARLVKAFNSVGAELLHAGASPHPTVMPVCGDDAVARDRILGLAADLGLDPLDAGPLRNAGMLEHLAALWMWAATRSGRGRSVSFALIER